MHHASGPGFPHSRPLRQTPRRRTYAQTGDPAGSIPGREVGKEPELCHPRFVVCCGQSVAPHWHELGQFSAKYPSLYNKAIGQFAHLWEDPVKPLLSPSNIGLAVGWVNATSVLRFSLPERAGAAVLQLSAPAA